MLHYRIFSSLFFKKYAWSCQVYRQTSSDTLEIIQIQLLQNFPLDKVIRAQLMYPQLPPRTYHPFQRVRGIL